MDSMSSTFPLPVLQYLKISSFEEYNKIQKIDSSLYLLMQDLEAAILYEQQGKSNFSIYGHCFVCNCESSFLVDYRHSHKINGNQIPNWRERLVCPQCGLNNRMRAIIHIFKKECNPQSTAKIYLTEQVTPLYKYIKQQFQLTIGSEYLGNNLAQGFVDDRGIRNESLTSLSFKEGQFDFLLSFDVLEHIPEYKKAFSECFRVLKPEGKMVFTVPFAKRSEKNIIRAIINETGEVTHIKNPVYHGDPLNKKGILCYQDFGWEMLEELQEVGFNKVQAIIYGSRFYGYLGGGHIAFIASK